MVITSNTECTIFMNDFRDHKFDVLEFAVSENFGKSWNRDPKDMDTTMNLMVTNAKSEQVELGVTSILLDCAGNVKCVLTFDQNKDTATIEIKDQNLIVLYNVKENTERLKSQIRREE